MGVEHAERCRAAHHRDIRRRRIVLVATLALLTLDGTAPRAPVDSVTDESPSIRDRLEGATRYIERREYEPSWSRSGLQAPNRSQRLRTYFRSDGIEVHDRITRDRLFALSALRFGRPSSLIPLGSGEVTAEGSRAEIRRAEVTEWFANSPRGLEQGFDVHTSPPGVGPLTIELAVEGATASIRNDSVYFSTSQGRRLRYGELFAFDATGRSLPSRFVEASGTRIQIAVDDTGATYPVVIDPLISGTADASINMVGIEVASAGDVDADGYSDLVVASSGYDGGEDHEGAVFIFRGGEGTLPNGDVSDADSVIESNVSDLGFGFDVAGIGDVNGDGFDDIGVGTYNGPAYVFHGGPSGIASGDLSSAAATISPGALIDGAGDVNGDGYDDVVVTTTGNAYTKSATAAIFHGSASGIESGDRDTAETVLRYTATYHAYWRATGAGDVDGDGYDDLLIGIEHYGSSGAAFLFRGGPDGIPDGTPDSATTRLEASQLGAYLGSSVASAGDVNGDGFDDIVVGARWFDGEEVDEGAAFVFQGSQWGIASGDVSTAATPIYSGQASAGFGSHVASAGDVDADGFDDLLVSSYSYDLDGHSRAVFLFRGSASGIFARRVDDAAATFTVDGWFGSGTDAAYGAGDLDGDGYGDIVLATRYYGHGPEEILLYRGSETFRNEVIRGEQAHAQFGFSVDGAGDVNGDGLDDVIIGAPQYDAGEPDEGAAFLFHGRSQGPVSDISLADARIESDQAYAFLGERVAGAADVNGDGFDDVIVSVRGYGFDSSSPEDPHGAAMVFHGGPDGIGSRSPLLADSILTSGLPGRRWELPVEGAGDVDGDGYDDVIFGEVRQAGYLLNSDAFVFHGSPSGVPSGTKEVADTHIELWGYESFRVGGAGDVNGDGFDDIVVAALNMGALVFHGSAAGIPSGDHLTADTRLQEQVSHLADFGGTAAGAGDVNGDGYDDLIVGRPGWWEDSYYGATSGAFVFHGGSGGIADGSSASANGSLMATEIFAKMGSGVAGIGDIDQDGYDDIIVGRGGDHVNPPGIPESALIYLGGPEGFGTKTDLDADMRIEPTATTPGWSGMDHGPSGVGYAMAAAGDVNGDGYGDIIVGGYAEAIDEIEEGTSRVILPEPDALPTLFCCLLLLSVLARARARDR